MLNSESFQQDSRILEAKRLVLEALKDHQKEIALKPADPQLILSYETMLNELNQARGGKLWHPYLGSGFGKEALVELMDGSIKYDFISGIGVHFFGHSDPDIVASSFDAALSDTVMEGHLQQNKDTLDLCLLLKELSGMDHCFLTSSGVMANENGLKIAFQKKFPASRILAFERCFTGRTLSLSQVTDKAQYREGLPHNLQVDYLPFYDASKPEESVQITVQALKKILYRYPQQHAAMIFELIQGEGGYYPGEEKFFKEIIKVLKDHNILILMDEVQTFGRTPALFATDFYGLRESADIITIGKLSQICATLFRQEITPRAGLLSQTFTASTTAIRAALVILKKLHEGNYYGPQGRMKKIEEQFKKHFDELSKKYPGKINGPYGVGAMVAFTYEDGSQDKTIQFAKKLFDHGLITFIAGSNPIRIRMLPPALVLSDESLNHACRIIEECL